MRIEHDTHGHRFVITDPRGEAVLNYSLRGSVMNIYHVFVPSEMRGGGVAGELVGSAMRHAREQKYTVIPTCPYVANQYLPRHPEFADLVKK